MAIERNVEHYSRHLPWGGASGDGDLILFGVDYSAATFKLTLAAAAGGTALFTPLTNAAAGSQGVSAALENPFVHPVTGEESIATIVTMQIDESTFEALTWGADPTAPLVLAYDLLATPSGEPQQALCYGTFTLYPGIGD